MSVAGVDGLLAGGDMMAEVFTVKPNARLRGAGVRSTEASLRLAG